jgi:tetratricopeptide repeat protein
MDPISQDEAAIAALRARVAELEAAGSVTEAIPVAESWAGAAKAYFGEAHPSYAAAVAALGGLLRRAGRLEEAEVLLRLAVAIYLGTDGAHSLELARTYGQLAQTLYDAGHIEEAEALRGYAMMAPPPPPPEEEFAGGPPGAAGEAEPAKRDAPPADRAETELPGPVPAAPPASRPLPPPAAPARPRMPEAADVDRPSAARSRAKPAETEHASFASERRAGPILREKVDAKRALEIDAGRLAYQIPQRMWVDIPETVEVRLGRAQAQGLTQGFGGRGEVKTEDIPIVETMSVTLLCEPGAFDIQARSEKDQLVKPDLVLGTAFHSDDFGRWVWLVTPRRRGEHTLLVKVSAAIRDSRGLPTTSSLPDKTFAVSVRVQLLRAMIAAIAGAVPKLVWVALTTVVGSIVGILTKDYWWPAIRRLLGWE